MAEPYFIWKDIDSRDMGVVVNELPPYYKPKAKGVTEQPVPGRTGTLHIEDESEVYETYVKAIPCYTKPTADISAVSAWLDGDGKLIVSEEPLYQYSARIDTQFSLDKIMRGWPHKSFTIPFICQPYKELVTPASVITLTSSGSTVTNPGTLSSCPSIRINCTGGDVTFIIGDNDAIEIEGATGTWAIIMDSEMKEAFNSTRTVLRNSWMDGDFPKIKPGENVVIWTGNVTSVQITPNWRWL